MLKRTFTFAALAVGIALITAAVPTHAFTTLKRVNTLTFNGPVALPGVVLPAGSYIFESGPSETDRNVVRVASTNYQKVYFQRLTIPTRRPRGMPPNRVLLLGEASPGRATPIAGWYPLGSPMGFEFRYR